MANITTSGDPASRYGAILPEGARAFITRRMSEVFGIALLTAAAFVTGSLLTYFPGDPSLNSSAGEAIMNMFGQPGAYTADFLMQTFGVIGAVPALVLGVWGVQSLRKHPPTVVWARLAILLACLCFLAISVSNADVPHTWPLATRLGGVIGAVLLDKTMLGMTNLAQLLGFQDQIAAWTVAAAAGTFGTLLLVSVLGVSWREWKSLGARIQTVSRNLAGRSRDLAQQFLEREDVVEPPVLKKTIKPRPRKKKAETNLVAAKKPKPKTGRKAAQKSQGKLKLVPEDSFELPPYELLEAPPTGSDKAQINKDSLQQNARLLETVLDDFGVKGEILKVRPGPVVTLYELEPAPGTKTSRVIGLSDDIARSMSAVSVRVAVVPGRNVIGIELPNVEREMVYLRELLSSEPFERSAGKLNLALGKDIGGLPVTVDLARMPHLLIAGTTGSGKSVGINTMILSLLYQLSPDECKLIMIDPKMLELSVYEGIPHLLTPVVTDPSKAVMALKWAVREMEERYRAMSQLGVRNIAGYNNRLAEARKKGETLTRRVQTGFDDDGKPVMEEQPLSMDPLPFIVVVVDEMADLMLVAGKDIEAAVQRLAQMARAAGIHMIMATQRPSVDVITGTIKANFPTRISFQVTSKIDSRTILGEQGAEQLLGQGDMLYMAGGGRLTRVHGPFVSDEEVEHVVSFLKDLGPPQYLDEVTEETDDQPLLGGTGQPSGDELYDEAVALIAREGKASTSFIQRHLQIGYNRAARIIEQMESEGVVSKANRVGRREVLVGGGDHAA